jgi:hypothetical protein
MKELHNMRDEERLLPLNIDKQKEIADTKAEIEAEINQDKKVVKYLTELLKEADSHAIPHMID